jgi:NitT/TauT family transport system substrate-binding protein
MRIVIARVLCAGVVATLAWGGPQPLPNAQAAESPKVTIAVAVDVLSFAALWVAQETGLFQKHGVDATVTLMEGGGPAVQALVAGSVQFSVTDSSAVALTHAKGVTDPINVETPANRLTLDTVVRKAVVDRLHLSRQMPIADRMRALKGLTIAITSPGAASDVFARYYLRRVGLDPSTAAKFVAVGGVPAMLATMTKGQTDAFLLSPPAGEIAESEGVGQVIISAVSGDVPELSNFAYEGVITTQSYARAHPDVVRAVATAIAEGGNLMHDDPAAAEAALEKHFSKVKPEILKVAVRDITPAVPRNGRSNEESWANLLRIDRIAGIIPAGVTLSTKEGVLWTNQYLPR